jgi:hypothetical protein
MAEGQVYSTATASRTVRRGLSATRALKNSRWLRRNAPQVLLGAEPPEFAALGTYCCFAR